MENKSDIITIKKNNLSFNIKDDYSKRWFAEKYHNWEGQTFVIFDKLLKKNKSYIDVGAWIGPTVLYTANICKNVYAFEPDPTAFERLKTNVHANNYKNLFIHNTAINANNIKSCKFGGNGKLGNSQSTLLVNDENYINNSEKVNKQWRSANIIEVPCVGFDKFLQKRKIDPSSINLIKMDIEGGEKYVIPASQKFLRKNKQIKLYISLHWMNIDMTDTATMLFDIYKYAYNWKFKEVTLDDVLTKKMECIIFSHDLMN